MGQYFENKIRILSHGKFHIRVIDSTLSAGPNTSLFIFPWDSIWILLFFRSMENHGKTCWILTPPLYKLCVLFSTKSVMNLTYLCQLHLNPIIQNSCILILSVVSRYYTKGRGSL
jgi:hypothetical protein